MPAEQFRRDRLSTLADMTSGIGLEIGPLDRPIILRSQHNVRYVDVFDTERIRDHYRHDPGVNVEEIPELDFALQSSSGDFIGLVEAVSPAAPYNWVVASHVIEHVPDLVGWLSDIGEILVDDGILVLAIPDRRFTFDALRPMTTVGQILEAADRRDSTPSIRAIYDYFRTVVSVSAADIWAGQPVTSDQLMHDLPGTQAQIQLARQGQYVDCHVWLFTPTEFVEQICELGRMNLIDLTVESIIPTAVNEFEFYASLKRIPRGLDPTDIEEIRSKSMQQYIEVPVRPIPEPVEEVEPTVPEAISEPPAPAFPLSDREIRLVNVKRKLINSILRRKTKS